MRQSCSADIQFFSVIVISHHWQYHNFQYHFHIFIIIFTIESPSSEIVIQTAKYLMVSCWSSPLLPRSLFAHATSAFVYVHIFVPANRNVFLLNWSVLRLYWSNPSNTCWYSITFLPRRSCVFYKNRTFQTVWMSQKEEYWLSESQYVI